MSEETGKCSDCYKRSYCKTQCRANKERIKMEANALISRTVLRGFNNMEHYDKEVKHNEQKT